MARNPAAVSGAPVHVAEAVVEHVLEGGGRADHVAAQRVLHALGLAGRPARVQLRWDRPASGFSMCSCRRGTAAIALSPCQIKPQAENPKLGCTLGLADRVPPESSCACSRRINHLFTVEYECSERRCTAVHLTSQCTPQQPMHKRTCEGCVCCYTISSGTPHDR